MGFVWVGAAVVGSGAVGCAVGDRDTPQGFADGFAIKGGTARGVDELPPEGAGGRGAATSGAGGGPGLACESQPDCESCSACAIDGPCFSAVGACDAEPRCRVALDCLASCYSACAGQLACLQPCTVDCNDPSGASQQANSVMSCACGAVCALSCRDDFTNRCEASFF